MAGHANSPLYTVIEDEIFKEQSLALPLSAIELDDLLTDVIWVIARIPCKFKPIPNTSIRRAVYDGTPRLRIWFSFDGTQIILRSIEQYGPNEI